eukprot:GHRR01025849.1.p1 GENE.GHRR01025849.1~~GHRR01025849.1.p1  ORF type:complete len:138 (+),score=11.89 GHRR01025849.1:1444-1857(+)
MLAKPLADTSLLSCNTLRLSQWCLLQSYAAAPSMRICHCNICVAKSIVPIHKAYHAAILETMIEVYVMHLATHPRLPYNPTNNPPAAFMLAPCTKINATDYWTFSISNCYCACRHCALNNGELANVNKQLLEVLTPH